MVDQLDEPWPGTTTLTGSERADERALLSETGVALMAWSPLAGGFLTSSYQPDAKVNVETKRCYDSWDNRSRRENALELAESRGCSLEQIAIAYAASPLLRASVVCAARSGPEAKANVEAVSIQLTDEERRWLEEVD